MADNKETPTSKLKVRWELHCTLSQEELQRELRLILNASTHPLLGADEQGFDKWALHPDERILIALIESRLTKNLDPYRRLQEERKIIERAFSEATRREEVWNPVIDAMAKHDVWISLFSMSHDNPIDLDREAYMEQRLAPWIQYQDINTVIDFVQNSDCSEAIATVSESMPLPAVSIFKQLIRRDPYALYGAARREDLEPKHVAVLLNEIQSQIIQRLTFEKEEQEWHGVVESSSPEPEKSVGSQLSSAGKVGVDIGLSLDEIKDPSNNYRNVLRWSYSQMADRGLKFTPEQFGAILSELPPSGERDPEEWLQWRGALEVLSDHICLTQDQEAAKKYLGYLIDEELGEWVGQVLGHPHDSPDDVMFTPSKELGQWLVERGRHSKEVLLAVANNEEMREVPEIRSVLLENADANVAAELFVDLREEEFRPLFQRFLADIMEQIRTEREDRKDMKTNAKTSPVTLIIRKRPSVEHLERRIKDIFEYYGSTAERTLEAEDIQPLFSLENRELRVRAIQLLGHIQERKSFAGESIDKRSQHRR